MSLSDGRPSQVDGLAIRLAAQADQVPVARRAVADYCERCGLPAPLIDDVKLVVTEACTNVVLHAYEGVTSGACMFEVHAQLEPGTLLLSVSDQGRGIGAPSSNAGSGWACGSRCRSPVACRRARAPAGSEPGSRCASPCRAEADRRQPGRAMR